jgi:hypothetical protein
MVSWEIDLVLFKIGFHVFFRALLAMEICRIHYGDFNFIKQGLGKASAARKSSSALKTHSSVISRIKHFPFCDDLFHKPVPISRRFLTVERERARMSMLKVMRGSDCKISRQCVLPRPESFSWEWAWSGVD